MELHKTLYITDLDGTLLDNNQRVPTESIEILNRLMSEGLAVSYATARSIVSASKVTEGLKITVPVVTSNGVSIVHPETRDVIYATSFEKEDLQKIIGYMKMYDIYPVVFSYINGVEKCSYVHGKETAGIMNYLNQPVRKSDKRMNPVADFESLFEGNVFYISKMVGEKLYSVKIKIFKKWLIKRYAHKKMLLKV